VPSSTRPGILDHRVQFHAAVVGLTHARLLLRPRQGDHPGRQSAVRAMTAVTDVAVGRWLARQARPRPGVRLLIDAAVVAGWALDAPGSDDTNRSVYVAASLPHSVESGIHLAAGSSDPGQLGDAPRQLFERSWLAPLFQSLVVPVVPALVGAFVRRRRGRPMELGQAGWGLLSVAAGWALGYSRSRQVQRLRTEFDRASARRLEVDRQAAAVRLATKSSPGHDFKKTLAVLGAYGSAPARVLAQAHGARPARVLQRATGGSTLFDVFTQLGVWPEPPDRWHHWLTPPQVATVERFVADGPSSPDDDDDAALVDEVSEGGLRVTFRGRHVVLVDPPLRPQGRVDVLAVAAGLGTAWKLLRMRGLPAHGPKRALLLAGVATDAATTLALALATTADVPTDWIIASTVAAGAVFDLAARRPADPATDGGGVIGFRIATAPDRPATTGLLGPAVLLGCFWSEIGRHRWVMAGGLAAAWVASRPDVVSSRRAVVEESLWLLELFFASKNFQRRLRCERDDVAAALADDFQRRRQAVLRQDVDAELDRLADELRVAERELALLQDELGPDIAADLAAECDELRAWLVDPATAAWLLS
jgi:hypothetical protein